MTVIIYPILNNGNLNEEAWIRQLAAKDERVMGKLYDHYSAALYGVIIRITGNHEIAEEIMVSVYRKALETFPKYDAAKGTLFTWMVNMARNQAAAHRTSGNLFYSETENDELVPEYRQIIDMIFFHGYTQQEAADKLNIPLGTVKRRLRAALKEADKIHGENIMQR